MYNLESISDADIVIEAVLKNDPKKEMFAKIDKLAKEHSILATNTSTLDIDQMADLQLGLNMLLAPIFLVQPML